MPLGLLPSPPPRRMRGASAAMRFMYGVGSCSIGIRALLEEVGAPYVAQRVDLAAREQDTPAFLALNPKGKVPAIVLDGGGALTEWPALATWLARTHAAAGLLPSDPLAEARVLETVEYVVATVHMQGFTRIWRPFMFTPNPADHEAVREVGRAILTLGLSTLEGRLAQADHVCGALSIADFCVFYVSFWVTVRLKQDLPPRLQAHYRRMTARPSVARALAEEGFAPP